jgi:hypothetical protein
VPTLWFVWLCVPTWVFCVRAYVCDLCVPTVSPLCSLYLFARWVSNLGRWTSVGLEVIRRFQYLGTKPPETLQAHTMLWSCIIEAQLIRCGPSPLTRMPYM